MNAELTACCSSLGFIEGSKYHKEPDCIETIKDLIRFIKREDETCSVRRQLGEAQIVQKDLIPLIKKYSEDRELFDVALRLLVNLTQPAIICFGGKIPEDKTQHNYYLEITSHLQDYKEAFADEELYSVLTTKLETLLTLDWEHRQEEDTLVTERIVILFRNILQVPANSKQEQRTDDDASIHDQILWVMNSSHLDSLLLYIANSEQSYCMHILEIISLMFREQNPEQLASAGVNRAQTEKEKDERELLEIRQREISQKKANMHKFNTRHSRFGGTYAVRDLKSISERDLIYHRPLSDIKSLTFDKDKVPKKKPKNKRALPDLNITRRSTLSIRLFLKDFCIQFLETAYNSLMHVVKDKLVHKRVQEHDETYYLWALTFFMNFNRLYKFKVELVSETLSLQTFHYIHTQLENYYESMLVNKKEIAPWSYRMHLALKTYQEVLKSLAGMDNDPDSNIRESARVIKSNLFYVMEYREIFHTLLRRYTEAKHSKSYVKDLIETVHIFLKLMETFCKSQSHIIVQKNKKKKLARRKKSNTIQTTETPEEQIEQIWDRISEELSLCLQGQQEGEFPVVTPFDAASEIPVEEQKSAAMIKIQDAMREGNVLEAVALFRAAREVWHENDEFGSLNITPDEEFIALREVLFTDLPRPVAEVTVAANDEENLEEEEMVGGGEGQQVVQYEQEFKFGDYTKRFCNPNYMQPYSKLLASYKDNSAFTNHCIVKMFHRVAWDCKLYGMFFQASLFRTFQKILEDPASTSSPSVKELATFAKYVVGKFFELAPTNTKMFMELLFWKEVKEVIELEEGYGTFKAKSSKVKILWTEEQEEELKVLYDEYKNENDDIIELIQSRLIDQTKTRRQIMRQMVVQGLINSAKDLKAEKFGTKIRLPVTWQEEEVEELKQLFERFKKFDDPMSQILNALTVKRSKQNVIAKILELELVQDRKALYKKRKSKKSLNCDQSDESNADDYNDNQVYDDSNEDNIDADVDDEAEDQNHSENDITYPKVAKQSLTIQSAIISDLLQSVHEQGFGEAVKWISEVLRRTADDRDEDGYLEAIPIVPLTEDSEIAMNDMLFQKFLKSLGIREPIESQEVFWRIPTNLTSAMLRCLADGLKFDANQSASEIKEKQLECFKELENMSHESKKVLLKSKEGARSKISSRKEKQKSNSSSASSKLSKTITKRQNPTKKVSQKLSKTKGKKRSSGNDSTDDDRPLSSFQASQEKTKSNGEKKRKASLEKQSQKKKNKEKVDKKQQSKHSTSDIEGIDMSNIVSKKRSRKSIVTDGVSYESNAESVNNMTSEEIIANDKIINPRASVTTKKRIKLRLDSSEEETENQEEVFLSNGEEIQKPIEAFNKKAQRKILESDSSDGDDKQETMKMHFSTQKNGQGSSGLAKKKRTQKQIVESDSSDDERLVIEDQLLEDAEPGDSEID